MKKLLFLLLFIWFFAAPAFAATIFTTGPFTQPNGVYHAPTVYYWMADGVRQTGHLTFSNPSTISGPNVPGQVMVNLTGVTVSSSKLDVSAHIQAIDLTWVELDDTLYNPDAFKADVSGVLTASAFDNWTGGVRGSGGGGTAYVNATSLDNYFSSKHGFGAWGGTTGDGNTAVDSTLYPALVLTTTDHKPGGFIVRFFLTSDYAAGHRTDDYAKAWSSTLDTGLLASTVWLNVGVGYTAVWTKPGYAPVTQEVTPHA